MCSPVSAEIRRWHQILWNWSLGWPWAAIWVLWAEPSSSIKDSALDWDTIFSDSGRCKNNNQQDATICILYGDKREGPRIITPIRGKQSRRPILWGFKASQKPQQFNSDDMAFLQGRRTEREDGWKALGPTGLTQRTVGDDKLTDTLLSLSE